MATENILGKFNELCKLSTTNKSVASISSNIMHKYQEQAMRQRLKVDTGPTCCKWCFNLWTPGNFSVEMCSQKHPKHRVQSMLKKDFSSLNKYQQKLVSKIKSRKVENSLVMKCFHCQKITSVPLYKQEMDSRNEEENVSQTTEVTKKKKRKKKDIFAGLNAAAVQSVKGPADEEFNKVKPKSVGLNKKPREISYRQQLNIHRAILKTPSQKKKPSLLDSFLNSL